MARILRVAADWGLEEADWDLLIVGDGSGSGRSEACGWSCTLVDRHARGRKLLFGGLSEGSIGMAEILPAIHALSWYEENYGDRRRARSLSPLIKVVIATDCQLVADQGNRIAAGGKAVESVRANRPFWRALAGFEPLGYALSYRWIPRDSLLLLAVADDVGRRARRAIRAVGPPVDAAGKAISIHDCNPDGGAPAA